MSDQSEPATCPVCNGRNTRVQPQGASTTWTSGTTGQSATYTFPVEYTECLDCNDAWQSDEQVAARDATLRARLEADGLR